MDDDTFRRAKRFEHDAVERVLGEFYPFVNRVTLALIGRADVGSGVVRYVMRRSLQVLPKWQHGGDPPRWFAHHTIISTRRAAHHRPDFKIDTLRGPQPQPKYTAFIAALRDLPNQQREAYILRECESLDFRQTAVAMDCSTEAAANHLQAAIHQLQLIAGPDYDRLSAALKRTYAALAPPEDLQLPTIRRHIRRYLWPRRVKKLLALLALLAILVALYWAASRFGLLPERFRIN